MDLTNLLLNKTHIIGADEVGAGSYAGPICVGGVKAPKDWSLEGLNDSKKLSPKRREIMRNKLIDLLQQNIIQFHIAERSSIQIDEMGLGFALKDAYVEIFKSLYESNCLIISDGILKFDNLNMDQISIIKADTKIPTVMAASILAKTYRDQLMKNYHEKYPQYDFQSHVGYGTSKHQIALEKYGPCEIHRFSYEPIKKLIK